ncbi:hypothetical protein [Rhizobium sp. L43]|uniref:hypothetical protein n=1 Tax=Rhizobium sp. L43 TaxID=2035452 RepID=UPI001FDEF325|nr:hypothetical protein [Rhizobium sp. L43]
MGWHAYIDESYTPDGDAYVIGGCIATDQDWAIFSAEWCLFTERFGRLDARGHRYFHMAEMAHRLEEVGFFYSVITKHVPVFVSARFNRSEFNRAESNLHSRNCDRMGPAKLLLDRLTVSYGQVPFRTAAARSNHSAE